ncbi:MAG TPA: long-chain fatty acid--CoA ligase [Pyrinomonadaceae bacterium]|nr:long-chain fatty acid--CoA ligase [Pyrinomonadaceae bacterium]
MASAASAKIDSTNQPIAPARSSVPSLCLTAALKHNKQDALNNKVSGEWVNISATAFVERVRHVALGLASLGIRAGDRVALLSENRPEWSITDLAILSLGAVNVPIYTTQAVDQVEFILSDSGARAMFVSGKKVYRHAAKALENLSMPLKLIFFDEDATEGIAQAITLSELERKGAERAREHGHDFDEMLNAVHADDLATIIYTSGTTGEPKGVMLSHESFISNVLAITAGLPINPNDIALSVLPLSHIFERTGFYIFCYNGVSVYYCGSFDQVGEHLREVRPTIMTAVPRLFEKVYHRIIKKGSQAKGWRRRVFMRALDVGHRYAELQDKRQRIPSSLALQQKVADKLVFSKWREGVGGRLRYFVSGGAPLSPTLSYAFMAAGIPVLQGYGATESCIVSANRPANNLVGSVGQPFEGIEIKLAEDGEIIIRGPNVMQGYYNHPEASAQVLQDGWFATGDVGHIDDEGRLFITDRKKDLFKLSNGKYIAPQLLESLIKESEFVSQVVVVGAGRKQPAALIVPDWESLRQKLTDDAEPFPKSRGELSRHPAAIKLVQKDVSKLTAGLADYERIRRVALLPDELTIDNGELTPTLKVKRRVIDEKFGELIAEIYS